MSKGEGSEASRFALGNNPGQDKAYARVEALLLDLRVEGLDRKAALAGAFSAVVNLAVAGWLIGVAELVAKEAGHPLGVAARA